MTKPIMTPEAVIAAARDVHLHGGDEVDLQALAGEAAPHCYYRAARTAPAHCRMTVCVIGAFLLQHGLLEKPADPDNPDGDTIGSLIGRVADLRQIWRLVEVPDPWGIQRLQDLHDSACSNEFDRTELRELLRLGPA